MNLVKFVKLVTLGKICETSDPCETIETSDPCETIETSGPSENVESA